MKKQELQKLILVKSESVTLPNEERIRKVMYENADRSIENTKLFCARVEAQVKGLIDTRLDTDRGTVEVLNEYAKYLELMKINQYIWVNHAVSNGYKKIYFEA